MMRVLTIQSFLLVISLQPSAGADWSPDLIANAKQVVQAGNIHLTGDVVCEYGSGDGQDFKAYQGDDALALLRVASQGRIYLFAHGFYGNARRTKPPLSYAFDNWGGYLDIIRSLKAPYSACLFVSDTAAGFGDHQRVIGDFLFALRVLTDDPELFQASRKVMLIGYSAGANYIKQALVHFLEHLSANRFRSEGIAPTRMRIVFLAGVHNGTDAAALARAGVLLLNAFGRTFESQPKTYQERSDQRWREFLRSEQEALVTSRGAQQLSGDNQELMQLNSQFREALTPNIETINIGSNKDSVATPRAVQLPFIRTLFLETLSHSDFVTTPLHGEAAQIARSVLGATALKH